MTQTASNRGVSARPGSAKAELRGPAPALAGCSRPAFVRHRVEAALLDAAGQPLSRRTRRLHNRLGGRLAGSGVAHALLLVIMALSFAQPPGGRMQEPSAVEMMYDHPGTSGMSGPTSKETPTPPPPATKKPEEQKQPTPMPQESPPPPVPETVPLPQSESPEPLPTPQKQPSRTQKPQPPSPFSHPMDLSFAARPSPSLKPYHRPSGSGAAIDLSLGPMVRAGKLFTPYASTTGIKGVSDDYGEELSAWIRRHMYYPDDAAKRGEEGPSSVHVVLDRQGRVKGIRLVTSSGSFALDDATQGMFRNAQLPPVPPDMIGNSFDVDLTIDYILIRR